MKIPIRYSIFPSSPEAHLFEVRCTVTDPDPAGQQFSLPIVDSGQLPDPRVREERGAYSGAERPEATADREAQ